MIFKNATIHFFVLLLFLLGNLLLATDGQSTTRGNQPTQTQQDNKRPSQPPRVTPKQQDNKRPSQPPRVTPKKGGTRSATKTQALPQLSQVENKGCVHAGDILRLKGKNLGRPGSYSLHLRIDGKSVDVTAAAKSGKWKQTQIEFKLPNSVAPIRSKKSTVQIGFQQRSGSWLTSTRFNLCRRDMSTKSTRLKPQLLKVENRGCVSPGELLRLKGKNFGRPGSQTLSLRVNGKTVDVTTAATRKKWLRDRIELRIPESIEPALSENRTARIGFLNKRNNWTSHLNFTLCRKIDAVPTEMSSKKDPILAPDLAIKSMGTEEVGEHSFDVPPYGQIKAPGVNYVFTIGNIGTKSVEKSKVLIECFDENGKGCPYGPAYHGLKWPIYNLSAPTDSQRSNSKKNITVGPFPLFGKAIKVTWRITVDPDNRIIELKETNNTHTFSYQEPKTDLFSIFTIKLDRDLSQPQSPWMIVPDFQFFSGYHEDLTKESYQELVKSGPSKVLIECFSKSGFKCPPEYPVSIEVDYLQNGYSHLCREWNICQQPSMIGHFNISQQDMLMSKTEWMFKATVDADNRYPEMDENNNVEYATISWAGENVKITDTDAETKSEVGFGLAQENNIQENLLPPVIDSFLVIPQKSSVPMPLGSINPGSIILLQGKRFIPKKVTLSKQKILLFGDFGVRELGLTGILTEEKTAGLVPSIAWPAAHTTYLRIVRSDGKQSPPKDIQFYPSLDTIKLDLESGKKVVKVLHCGTDSNLDNCNGKVYHSQSGPNTIFHEMLGTSSSAWNVYRKDYPMQGGHANVWGAVGDDAGYDKFKISLKNGWIISKADFKVERFDADPDTKILSYTNPVYAEGKSEWTAKVNWQVDEGKEAIWYGYTIEISGPAGTSPFK